MAIDRLSSGRFRTRLMIDGLRYTATWPTETDAYLWEIELHAAVVVRRRASSVTFADDAKGWLAESIDDAPDRARFEAALAHRILPVLGALPLIEVPDADRDELHLQLVDADGRGDDDATWECLELVLEDAIHELDAGTFDVRARVGSGRSGR